MTITCPTCGRHAWFCRECGRAQRAIDTRELETRACECGAQAFAWGSADAAKSSFWFTVKT